MGSDQTPLQRADELLRRMTLDEKVSQLTGMMPHSLLGPSGVDPAVFDRYLAHGPGHVDMLGMFLMRPPRELAAAVNTIQRYLVEKTRLGIPAIFHGEAISGFIAPNFSAFPTAIGLAATWEPDRVREMADLIRQQMRAVGFRQALSPVLDIARDARWGRVHETYGEDPYLTSALGVAFTRGLQGDDLREGVIATAKHFLGYGLSEAGQNMAVTHLGGRELYDVFGTPFEAAIRLAGLRGIMNSYSEIDGVPVAGSPDILRDLLRGRMGFDGIVVSDYASVDWLHTRQGAADSLRHAGLLALQAGLDVELPSPVGFGAHFADDIREGRLDPSLLDDAVRRMLRDKFELGIFDHPYVREDAGLPLVSEGKALSARLAADSLTLLKNDGAMLPLSPDIRRIAVVGPHARAAMANFSAYTYPANREQTRGMATGQTKMAGIETFSLEMPKGAAKAMAAMMSALVAQTTEDYVREEYGAIGLADALRLAAPNAEVTAVDGVGVVDAEPRDIPGAVAAAAAADVVVLAIGGRSGWFGTTITEGEASDSSRVELPECQMELVRAVAATGTPMAAVVHLGRPYALTEVDELVRAMLAVYYPGPEGATAIAHTLFGALNPGGKLPYTLPRSTGQVPIYHYQKRGSGYRRNPKSDLFTGYVDGLPMTPLYPFGHGLSYTTFAYGDLALSASEVDGSGAITVSVGVTNTGDRPGDEVVQVYFGDTAPGLTRPSQQLVGFRRVHLAPGEEATVSFDIAMSQLGYTGRDGRFVLEPGPIDVAVGSSSDDIRARDRFTVVGDAVDLEGRRSYLASVTVRPGQVVPRTTSRNR